MSATPDLLRTAWSKPRATVRWVLDHGDGGLSGWLLVGAFATLLAPALATALRAALFAPGGGKVALLTLALAAPTFLFAAAMGLVSLAIADRLVGGPSNPRDLARAAGWGVLPLAAALPVAALGSWFAPVLVPPARTAFLLLGGFLALWALANLSFALAELHRRSSARGVAIVTLAAVLLVGVGVLLLATLVDSLRSA